MKITNTTRGDIGLQPDLMIPAGGSLEIDNDRLSGLKSLPSVKDYFISGKLVESGGVEAPVTAEFTQREAIIAGVIRGLAEDAFTKGGKPEVDAINAVLKWDDTVTAAERDAVWAIVEAESD